MEPQRISQADWAREQGVSRAYVSKLVRQGRIVLIDGKVDPEDAARRMAAQQDAVKHAKKLTRLTGRELTDPRGTVHSTDPAEHESRSDEIEPRLLPDQLLRARIKREREEGRLKELERRKREGEFVDAQEVRDAELRRAIEEREALLNWPSRQAPLMAAELGIERDLLLTVLKKYVRAHLAERSQA